MPYMRGDSRRLEGMSMRMVGQGRTAAVLVAVLLASGAVAQETSGADVKKMLFKTGAAEVEILPQPFLPEDQAAILAQVGATQPYYGAIAISPDEGLMVEATVAAANHHSTEAASAAAVAACEAKRKGATPCAVVALIRPEGWKQQAVQLSSGATEAFGKEYFKAKDAKAFAVSPATGSFGVGMGADAATAAVAACVAGSPSAPADCQVLLQE